MQWDHLGHLWPVPGWSCGSLNTTVEIGTQRFLPSGMNELLIVTLLPSVGQDHPPTPTPVSGLDRMSPAKQPSPWGSSTRHVKSNTHSVITTETGLAHSHLQCIFLRSSILRAHCIFQLLHFCSLDTNCFYNRPWILAAFIRMEVLWTVFLLFCFYF